MIWIEAIIPLGVDGFPLQYGIFYTTNWRNQYFSFQPDILIV